MSLREDARLALYPLAIREEDGQWIVGRVETGAFVALPEIGVHSVRALMDGLTLAEAGRRLADEHGVEIDILAFAEELRRLGFVSHIDGLTVDGAEARPANLPWLRAGHVGWIFSRPVKAAYTALLAAAGVAVALHPELVPRSEDFFWTTSTSLVLAGNVLFSFLTVAAHELFHLMAARSLDVPARISLSTRLHHLVAHTDVSGLWAVPRARRFRVYLAGMAWDVGVMAAGVVLLAWGGLPGWLTGPLSTGILIIFFGLVAQAHIYMRTDMYFVLLDLLRCRNLFWDAWEYSRYQWAKAVRAVKRKGAMPPDPLARLPGHERAKVRLYAWLQLLGSAIALGVFAGYGVPILWRTLTSAWRVMQTGIVTGEAWSIADGAVTLGVLGALQVVFLIAWIRPRRGAIAGFVRRGAAVFKSP